MARYNYHRRDANHKKIVEGLRQHGATVKDASQLDGFVDLVVLFRDKITLIEIKNNKGTKQQKQLTDMERKFHSSWSSVAVICETLEEALIAIGVSFKKIA